MSGFVYLVGAGPGDPGLLTRQGARCLEEADVVVHDYLVGPRLLAGVRPDAEVVAVGRSHGDPRRLSQADVDALLVDRARAGRVVVRLKSGDPFLFGRGGEEAEALARAGVPFVIVPGVTSALAAPAYAGIPVTHRDHASLVTIATGHLAVPGDAAPDLPWEALAKQGGTLVFLMAMRQLPAIMHALVAHGLDAATRAAAVEWGTTGRQRTVVATVGTLAAQAEAAALGPPGVIVVGRVVGVREQIRWFEHRPLLGRRVVVTRPRAQAAALAELLERAGADVLPFPTIAIAEALDRDALDRAIAAAAEYGWILFTSANGVRVFFERFAAGGRDVRELSAVRLAAIGPETARELERLLLRPAVVPEEHRAEGLLEALPARLDGVRILLPRAAGARPILPDTLRARGAAVDEVVAYRAVRPPDTSVDELAGLLADRQIDAITFTSSSTVRNFAAMLGPVRVRALRDAGGPVVACIGPVTAETARELGLAVTVVASEYTSAGLTTAVVAHFCKGTDDHLFEKPT